MITQLSVTSWIVTTNNPDKSVKEYTVYSGFSNQVIDEKSIFSVSYIVSYKDVTVDGQKSVARCLMSIRDEYITSEKKFLALIEDDVLSFEQLKLYLEI